VHTNIFALVVFQPSNGEPFNITLLLVIKANCIQIKVLDTDRRMGLLCLAILQRKFGHISVDEEIAFTNTPRNRISSKYANKNNCKWKYSYEIPNLKAGDQLHICRDNVVRREIVLIILLFYFLIERIFSAD